MFRSLILLLLCLGCSTPVAEITNNSEVLEGVVEKVRQVGDQIEITLDGNTMQYKCGLSADEFHVGEYHTFILVDDKIETVYLGESSGDLNDLEMLYND